MTPSSDLDQTTRNDAFADLVVEQETRDDGRYVLYYSWPDRSQSDDTRAAPSSADKPMEQQTWTPEAGPVEGARDV